jgi:hypothetical protein
MPDRCSSVVVKVRGDVCATSLEPRSTPVWRLAVLVSLSAICFTAHATVYKCKKADGSTVYSDIPCGPGAQTQVIQAPPSEGNAGAPQSNGTNQAVDRNQASACWLSKYDDWRTKNPQLAANSTVNLQTMQGFQRDCHWTARTRAFTTSSQAPVEGPSR